ncbi:MAG: Asparagine synthetase [glutamine-hydrolyzing] 1 [Nitrosomonadaceae bacterium]|nr:Asparagine synthetase [glutamine-hydrolyzing] 1 [Nitrosomonadaceae bacterium]
MCSISGILNLSLEKIPNLRRALEVTNQLQRHRGPDGEGVWTHQHGLVGFAHRRLSIIDLETGQQPMTDGHGNWITYNGELYNYVELRDELGPSLFSTQSDTEVILHAYRKWGMDCLNHFRGMFAFALWDEREKTLVCARDHFGIKPLYYTVNHGALYFASEAKALLPFVSQVETDIDGLKDYLTFQFCLGGKTLFKGIREVLPGHVLTVRKGVVETKRYWEVYYHLDFDHSAGYFEEKVRSLLEDSVARHLRSDVPIGAYVSGGFDSGIIASLAAERQGSDFVGFAGKFSFGQGYDESQYARDLASSKAFNLYEVDITDEDFIQNFEKIIYHLDYPMAGPGSFPQYMVSQLAAGHRKVVLGGQGGDEIFGGYARYLVAYFEQCIKAAIEGTMQSGNFIVTYESIIPNLTALRNYKPMLQELWREGLFEAPDRRYFRLVNRSSPHTDEIDWALLGDYSPYETFRGIFLGNNIQNESYFDSMTHFDFKTLLPALLHVEDRMSMAHGLESRVPFLDLPLVEFLATIPSNIKFKDGNMKHVLKSCMSSVLPSSIVNRTDKMGFPVPLQEWVAEKGKVRDFATDILSSQAALSRPIINNRRVLAGMGGELKFGRKLWGFLCLEQWQKTFHDKAWEYRRLLTKEETSL